MKLRNMSVRSGRNLRELPLVAYSFEKLVWNIWGQNIWGQWNIWNIWGQCKNTITGSFLH